MQIPWPSFVRAGRLATPVREYGAVDTKCLSRTGRQADHHQRDILRSRLEWALLLFLLLAFTVTGFIPAWRHLNSDFPNYYLVARLYRAGYPLDRVYEWTWLQRQKDYAGIDQGIIAFVPLTLPSALVVAPLASLPPLQAKRCWLVASLIFLLVVGWLLTRISDLKWRRVCILMFLALIPLRQNFMLGQLHVLVLLLLTLALCFFLRGSRFLAGIVLAIAAALKIYPALFLVLFLVKRQWRAAMGLCTGILGASLMSIYVFGRSACEVYVREILPASLRGDTVDPYHVAWGSITTLLRRLFIAEPELNPAPVAHLPWLYALLQPAVHVVIFVLFMWAIGTREGDQRRIKRDWAVYLFLLVFVSSQPAGYHFVVLILVVVLIADQMIAEGRLVLAQACVAGYALICLATYPMHSASPAAWHILLFFPRLVFMAIFAALLLFRTFSDSSQHSAQRLALPRQALLAVAVILLIVVGFFSTERHLSGQFDNYKNRVATSPGSLFESNPVVTSDRIRFTAMTTGGYTVKQAGPGPVIELARTDGDWFHPAAAQQSNSVWVEQASERGSRIMRLEDDNIPPTLVVEDAMEPVISQDGKWLAFFRAVKGRNSLWVQEIDSSPSATSTDTPRQLVGPEYDPRDVDFFPDDRLIFSSGDGKLYFSSALEAQVPREFNVNCYARYPAVSRDGRFIAFSCRQHSNWQLHVVGLSGDAKMQLTRGECNSITPAWTVDSKSLVYATDCGRGVGLTALAQLSIFR
jgi:hypothetical protein